MEFWEAVRNPLETVTDAISRIFTTVSDKAIELVGRVVDWTFSTAGAEALGFAPDGAIGPGAGVPVASAAWRPWMHLHLPLDTLQLVDTWFPLREAVGAVVIVSTVWASALMLRLTLKMFLGR